MTTQLKKEDLETFYKFLDHKKFTEIRIIDPREGPKQVSFVENFNDFLAICERYNGEANVYVGVNERFTKEGKAEHVSKLSIIPIDVDPVRPKGQASTDAELEIARQKMLQIRNWLKENFDCSPFITMSGNGFHLFIRIPSITLDQFSRPAVQEKVEALVHEIQNKFNDDKIHIDSTFDLPRVMKCPGTMSVKGDNTAERPWRICKIIEANDVPCANITAHLAQIKAEKTKAFELGTKTQAEFDALLQKDEKLRDLFQGKWKKYSFPSRSEAEQSLLTKLVAYGFSEESINGIMSQSKIGKWKERPDAYHRTSIENAVKFVNEHKGAIEPVKYELSCGKDLPDKIFEQTSDGEFLVYDKVTGEAKKEKSIGEFRPFERIMWKSVDEAKDYQSEQELWSEVKRFIYEHMDIQEGYDVLTAWVLASWTPERWNAVPYLFFFGPPASGKSRALEILKAIGHRPFMTSSASLSAIFRLIEMWHLTLFLDETEIYMRKDRTEVQNLLNSGYRKDAPAVRVEETREGQRVPMFYDCFGFKALAGTKDLMETLKSRCIVFSMSKAIREIKPEIDGEWAKAIREKLLAYRFKMLSKKEPQEKPDILRGRLRELFDPLIIVAPITEKNPIIQQAKKIEATLKEEEETSFESIVFHAIFKIHEDTQDEKITIANITKIVNEGLEMDEMLTNIRVGQVAKVLGFKKCLKGGGKRAIRWDKEVMERLIYRYGKGEKGAFKDTKRFRKAVEEYLDEDIRE
jgi:hypothetical protein